MSKDEALKLALEALEISDEFVPVQKAITAIREALAEQPAPFVLNGIDCSCGRKWRITNNTLTASEPEQQEPVATNDTSQERVDETAKQRHEQEPVAWRYKIVDCFGHTVWTLKTPKTDTRVLESQPLYTTPPKQEFVCSTGLCHYRKPLTDEQLEVLWDEATDCMEHFCSQYWDFARAIEAAHGIKE